MRRAAPAALIAVVLLLAAGGGQASSALPPVLDYACTPAPADCTGWYTSPVTLKWDWDTIHASQTDGDCSTRTFSQNTPGTRVFCEVTDNITGEYTGRPVTIHVDRTPPAVSATPDRPPDYNGWFNHPMSVGFSATDATSGVQACTSAGYAGPDAAGIVLGGTCQDVAGNVGGASFALNYDATPPAAPQATATPDDHQVTLRWPPAAGAELMEVARITSAGLPALVFRGGGTSFTDRQLRNEQRQGYLITSIDRAGNRAHDLASAVPTSSPLIGPPRGARVGEPPLLVWEAARRASYYNVQLYRGEKKVLSRWPRRARLQLSEIWHFDGGRRRLKEGPYTWFVFPGFGERSERRFGKLLGKSSFRVVG